jgi:hypothetical protein
MTHLAVGEERRTHQLVGQELAKAFTAALPIDMAQSFMRRSFLTYLDDEDQETTELIRIDQDPDTE